MMTNLKSKTAAARAAHDGNFAAEIWQSIQSHTGGWWDCEGCGECYDHRDAHAVEAFERNAFEAIHHACLVLAERDAEAVAATEMELRREWWLGHGHRFGALYGDDGEMQCHECRLWDYRRAALDELRHQVEAARREKVAKALAAAPVVERTGVRVTEAGHAWPDVPGGVAKDHAREKQPAVAYACLYQRLAQVARDHGYALAMHGSLAADLDLVAVPWTADAASGMVLATALAAAVPGSLHADQWTEPRPGGVKKHIIHLGGGPYLDLCVTPLLAAPQDDEAGDYETCESCEQTISGRVVRTLDDVPLCEACAADLAKAEPTTRLDS